METREARLIINKSGGTAGPGGVTYRVTLPTSWVRLLNFDEDRNVNLTLDSNKIIVHKDKLRIHENHEVFENNLTNRILDIAYELREEPEDLTEEDIKYYNRLAFWLLQIVNNSTYYNEKLGLALEEIIRITRELEGK